MAILTHYSSDSVLGEIRKVKDYVAVIKLDGVFYKNESSTDSVVADAESLKFGTNTRPGALLRNDQGHYFSFESHKQNLLATWSTELSAKAALERFLSVYPVGSARASGPSVLVSYDDGIRRIEEVDAEAAIARIMAGRHSGLGLATVALCGAQFSWQRPYLRFDDRETEFAEVGLGTADLVIGDLSAFVRRTGHSALLDSSRPYVAVRREGILRVYNV